MTVLLDLNVVLDALLGREPWRAEADAIWDATRDGPLDARMSAAALPTLFYVIRKQEDLARAHLAVTNCLRSLEIVPVNRTTLEMATADKKVEEKRGRARISAWGVASDRV